MNKNHFTFLLIHKQGNAKHDIPATQGNAKHDIPATLLQIDR